MSIILVIRKIILLILFLSVSYVNTYGQEPAPVPYSDEFGVSMEFMGGMSYNLKDYKVKTKRLNISPSFRIMWNPNRKLNIGIETTYLLVGKSDEDVDDTDFGKGKFEAELEALPIYLVFNMRLLKLDWTGGIGVSYMRSTILSFKEETISTNWYYCFNFGLGYTLDITKHFGIGLETKVFSLSKTNDLIAAGYLKFAYHIFY